jgi:hypothetical protein
MSNSLLLQSSLRLFPFSARLDHYDIFQVSGDFFREYSDFFTFYETNSSNSMNLIMT